MRAFNTAYQALRNNLRTMSLWLGITLLVIGALTFITNASPVWDAYRHAREDIVPLGTFVAAVIAGWVALRQVQIALRQAEIASLRHVEQTRADQLRRITESFSKAVEQLGNVDLHSRLGGIYSLERISRENDENYWTVLEILCGFLRERTVAIERSRNDYTRERAYYLWLAEGEPQGLEKELWEKAATHREAPPSDVRAALTVLSRRRGLDHERANNWRLDLRGITLRNLVFKGLVFDYADLDEVTIDNCALEGCSLKGAKLAFASISRSHIPEVDLTGAELYFCHVRNTNLQQARMQDATVLDVHFNRSVLLEADLRQTSVILSSWSGTTLHRASLKATSFGNTDLSGAIGLTYEQLSEAEGDMNTILPDGLQRPADWTKIPEDRVISKPDFWLTSHIEDIERTA